MKIKPLGYTMWATMLLILVACDQSTLCLSGQSAIQAGFYSGVTGEAKDTTLSGVYLWGYDELNQEALPLLIDSAKVQKMYLPTNIQRDTTSFVLREQTIASDIVDTIMFVYTRDLNYVSGDCGFTYNLHIDTVIHTINLIDSVVVDYPSVLYNENLENVKIFIEP